jgi:hypothetical protein
LHLGSLALVPLANSLPWAVSLTSRWCGRAASIAPQLLLCWPAAQLDYKDFPVSATKAFVPMEERTASL